MTTNKDVSKAIQAKSDQLNADDLIGGPITIKITDVDVLQSSEQPIQISYEGDGGRPWRPCKTAARCLAAIWGANAAQWVGMSCTIYNDTTVTWAGTAVGGIRVSHMQGIDKPKTLQLAKARGKKFAVTIQTLQLLMTKAPDTQTVDTDAILQEARDTAKKGKDAFNGWWKDNVDKRDIAKTIMAELKSSVELFEANNVEDDETPL